MDGRERSRFYKYQSVILPQKTGILAVGGRNRRKYEVPWYIALKACAVSGNCELSSCIKYPDVYIDCGGNKPSSITEASGGRKAVDPLL